MIDQICEGLKLFGSTRLEADGFQQITKREVPLLRLDMGADGKICGRIGRES